MNESLADLYRQAGLQPAWERTPQNQPGYTPPRPRPRTMRPAIVRAYDQNPGVRAQAMQQMQGEQQFRQNAYADTMQNELGRNEVNTPSNAYFGQDILETTGAPALSRSFDRIAAGDPGGAIPEAAMGALGIFGAATLPLGAGPRAVASRAPMGMPPRLPQALPEPTGIPRPPPRLPMRATDGSILPARPPEPFRNSMRGGSDDLMSAARSRPDAGGAQAGPLPENPTVDDIAALLRREATPGAADQPLTAADQQALRDMGLPDLSAAQSRMDELSASTREMMDTMAELRAAIARERSSAGSGPMTPEDLATLRDEYGVRIEGTPELRNVTPPRQNVPDGGSAQAGNVDLGHVRYWVERYGGGPDGEASAIREMTKALRNAERGEGATWQRRQQDLRAQIAAIENGSYRQGPPNPAWSARVEAAFPELYATRAQPNAGPPRTPPRPRPPPRGNR